jgi:hypothetical protein
MGALDTDDAILQKDGDLPPEEAFLEGGVEYVNSGSLSDILKSAKADISESWRRMRSVIGPF